MKKFTLTNFAAWSKYHFSKDPKFQELSFDEQLRLVLSWDGYDFDSFSNKHLAKFLLQHIEGLPKYFFSPASIIDGIDPDTIWKCGWYTMEYKLGKPTQKYNMYTAIIHYIKSHIAHLDKEYFLPELSETYSPQQ